MVTYHTQTQPSKTLSGIQILSKHNKTYIDKPSEKNKHIQKNRHNSFKIILDKQVITVNILIQSNFTSPCSQVLSCTSFVQRWDLSYKAVRTGSTKASGSGG